MKKKGIITALVLLVLLPLIAYSAYETWHWKIAYDEMMYIVEHFHSAVAPLAAEEYYGKFCMWLVITIVLSACLAVSIYAVRKWSQKQVLAVALLTLCVTLVFPLPMRWYAGVQLQTYLGDELTDVWGFIEPVSLGGIREGFVAYWIGVVNYVESTGEREWVGGGYFVNESGTYYYLEYLAGGVYGEHAIKNVKYGKSISVAVNNFPPGQQGWICWVTCHGAGVELDVRVDFSDKTVYVAKAGIESSTPENYACARFFGLYFRSEQHSGYWTDDNCGIFVYEQASYKVYFSRYYYSFLVKKVLSTAGSGGFTWANRCFRR